MAHIDNLSPSKKVQKQQAVSKDETVCEHTLCESTISQLQNFSFKQSLFKMKEVTERSLPNADIENQISCFSNFSTEELDADNIIELDGDEIINENELEVKSTKIDIKYTPLEKQYLGFKKDYPDAVLLIECGYKYRFFGEDAKIASKVLNIGCYKSHNFMSAIIPVTRLHFHVRRLVLKGYKVGVIKQIESAAIKAAGENRNELFSRKLEALYTKSTLIGDEFTCADCDNGLDDMEIVDDFDFGSGYLVCIYENINDKENLNIAFVAACVNSGNVVYSSFEDNLLRNKLESCLTHLNPSEVLLPSTNLNKKTEDFLTSFCNERGTRMEYIENKVFDHSFALDNISKLFTSQDACQVSSGEFLDNIQDVLSLPPLVLSCLSALVIYLSSFKLENVMKIFKNMKEFSTNECMVLNAATLKGLEVLKSNSNYTEHGSLLWILNKTLTKFGERMLKLWIAKPLKNLQCIEDRLNIVTELMHSESVIFRIIQNVLSKLPDLEQILCGAFYHRCSCNDLFKLIQALNNIRTEFLGITDKITVEVKQPKLRNILLDIPRLLDDIKEYYDNINPKAAKEGDFANIFLSTSMYPDLERCKHEIILAEKKLDDLRPKICKVLCLPGFKYVTVAGQKYLIEIPNNYISGVPNDWLKISATKQVSRFRSPEVIEFCNELERCQEKLIEYAKAAWSTFLNEFGKNFYKYKRAVSFLAELDCYTSFSKLAKEERFCRPHLSEADDRNFQVEQGWHPVISKLMGEEHQFVANDLKLNNVERCMIMTGPNMGGKSTYMRQIAHTAIMSHIGCYVPATSAILPLLDGIYVRIGADDDLAQQKSTFMVEMSETSEILASATSKSLVILDELGRGTSTNDGAAIAYATLDYLITEIKCFTLFVTHYPSVMELKNIWPEYVITFHMAYILKDKDDKEDIDTATFLYNVVPGISEKSYGINVAALAGISKDILCEAQQKSREIETKIKICKFLRKKISTLMI
ncbi:DNA mismatch repair protein Msh3-like isoform X2 [Stegodyphus dumicola]|uniref:DNA mismatch repair protein Msh3-like isoform X2 n=1 Tax=Stegodyphus dumicola TaxID=202533 RepID=UPI0015B2675A|nr:DNA mismatch repair protein Msh3-like isoform X2 [Stegodyphus dumicola]